MTILLMEGFDHYTSDAHAIDKGWNNTVPSYQTISSIYSRFGVGNGLKVNHTNGMTYKDFDSSISTLYFGGAIIDASISFTPAYWSTKPFLRFYDESGLMQVNLHVTATNELRVDDGGNVQLAISSENAVPKKQWFYIECKIIISATVGVVEVKINGTEIINETGLDTKYTASDYLRRIGLSAINLNSATGYNTYWDDIYVDDSQFHGDCRIRAFVPDSDGTTNDFTPSAGANFECVDDNPPDDDTTYNEANTPGNIDLYGITTGAFGTIKGIQNTMMVRKTDAGDRTVRPKVRSNSTNYNGTTKDVSADFHFLTDIWELDPDDSGAWTQTKLEAAEFGLEIVA